MSINRTKTFIKTFKGFSTSFNTYRGHYVTNMMSLNTQFALSHLKEAKNFEKGWYFYDYFLLSPILFVSGIIANPIKIRINSFKFCVLLDFLTNNLVISNGFDKSVAFHNILSLSSSNNS